MMKEFIQAQDEFSKGSRQISIQKLNEKRSLLRKTMEHETFTNMSLKSQSSEPMIKVNKSMKLLHEISRTRDGILKSSDNLLAPGDNNFWAIKTQNLPERMQRRTNNTKTLTESLKVETMTFFKETKQNPAIVVDDYDKHKKDVAKADNSLASLDIVDNKDKKREFD